MEIIKIQINILYGLIALIFVITLLFCILLFHYARSPAIFFAYLVFNASIVSSIFESEYVQRLHRIRSFSNNQFFSIHKQEFHLSNKNVVIVYNEKDYKLSVFNLKDNSQNFYMSSINRYKSFDIFQIIIDHFNMDTTYDILLLEFNIMSINIIENKKKIILPSEKKKISIININNATALEISKLPGINIVRAKKVIKYRKEHGGFKSKEEFFKVVKLNKRFAKMMQDKILIDKYNIINEYNKEKIESQSQEGREVDF